MDFSHDDKKKLAAHFQKEMAKKKAKELGIRPDELSIKVKDGKIKWIKRAELYQELEKQRKVYGPQKVVRALRDGDNSLLAAIEKEIRIARTLAEELAKVNIITVLEKNDAFSSITQIYRRLSTITIELQEVEENIERAKQSDSVLQEGEEVLKELKDAMETKDQNTISQLRSDHKNLLSKYENRRKALDPFILSARHHKADMQREYWRILQQRWKLQETTFKHYSKELVGIGKGLPDGPIKSSFNEEIKLLREKYHELIERHNTLTGQCPDSTADPATAMRLWDENLPVMTTMIEENDFLFETLQSILEKYKPHVLPSDESSKHMVFIEQRNK